ncbi:DUF6346 domain-containing protein [Actinoplanes sp. M2I2]|uniref:DUF6346 domain-containing protein n=1 Tax=Actinoplanes sp. M2I2 TaxID=1734444 RepID=UPI002020B76C|nr:DUF6346 domain-containing protein [Actinoplanes sp. M2I2]
MTDDEKRRAERRRRMDELLSQAEADVTRTRAAPDRPVVEQRRGTTWGSVLGVVILLVSAVVFFLGARTVNRFTGADFDDADRRGTATVESCERHGPITLKGFGYVDECTVDIVWSDGEGPTVLIDKPGFMKGEKPGETFEIGQNSGSRGSIAYSRPEVSPHGWATALTIVLAAIAFLFVAGVYLFLRQTIKDMRRR